MKNNLLAGFFSGEIGRILQGFSLNQLAVGISAGMIAGLVISLLLAGPGK